MKDWSVEQIEAFSAAHGGIAKMLLDFPYDHVRFEYNMDDLAQVTRYEYAQ